MFGEAGKHARGWTAVGEEQPVGSLAAGVECLSEDAGDFFLLAEGDAIEKWQREGAAGDGFGDGEGGARGAGMGEPGGLQMDRGEVTAGGDAVGGQGLLDAVPICGLG